MKKTNSENLEGKRGKKGGTSFPRYSLLHLRPLLKNLTSKTHTNPITTEQLNAGVFGISSKSTAGKVKSSALRQFGLLTGDSKKLKATELASKITMSEGEELKRYLKESFAKVSVFVNTLNTFQNSKTDKSKIGQYAVSTLKVHPDRKDDFVNILVESAVISDLASVEGNSITFSSLLQNLPTETTDSITDEIEASADEDANEKGKDNISPSHNNSNPKYAQKHGQISNINVNIDVDPSMDPEKLEKLLKLLKSYGAI